jgi:hypothetical protein
MIKSFALVKLVRATGKDTSDLAFGYEVLTHNMNGSVSTRLDVKDVIVKREYCKELKMRGKRHAVRYLNTTQYIAISEQEYDELVTEFLQE